MIALEHLPEGDWLTAIRNFERLRLVVPDAGGQSTGFRFGTSVVTWPGGSQTSSVLTVTHGLGRAPVVVLVTLTSWAASTQYPVGATVSYTTANFGLVASTTDGSSPAAATAATYAWVAIG